MTDSSSSSRVYGRHNEDLCFGLAFSPEIRAAMKVSSPDNVAGDWGLRRDCTGEVGLVGRNSRKEQKGRVYIVIISQSAREPLPEVDLSLGGGQGLTLNRAYVHRSTGLLVLRHEIESTL